MNEFPIEIENNDIRILRKRLEALDKRVGELESIVEVLKESIKQYREGKS